MRKQYSYRDFQSVDQNASSNSASSPKMLYYTIGSLIFLFGGAALWLGILYMNLQMIVAGGIVYGFGIISFLICHLIKKDKAEHRHIVHYECLLQRWYAAVIAFAFIIGCAGFWIGAVFELKQLLYIGTISHVLLIFTVFFDSRGNGGKKKHKKNNKGAGVK